MNESLFQFGNMSYHIDDNKKIKEDTTSFVKPKVSNPYFTTNVMKTSTSIKNFAKTELEKNILANSSKTKTVFYPNGSFVTTLPTGEMFGNRFETLSVGSMYVKELVSDFDDVSGFNVQYIDKADGHIRNWFVTFDEQQGKYYLHGSTTINSNQVDFEYDGTKEDFMSMINELINEASEYDLKNATIFQYSLT